MTNLNADEPDIYTLDLKNTIIGNAFNIFTIIFFMIVTVFYVDLINSLTEEGNKVIALLGLAYLAVNISRALRIEFFYKRRKVKE